MVKYLCMVVLSLAFGTFALPASAQMLVHVSSSGSDPIGIRLAYAVREGIRRSAGMTLVDSRDDRFLGLNLVTMDPTKNDDGIQTVYSLVWTIRTVDSKPVHMYLTSTVGACGSAAVSQCAESIVAATDKHATEYRSVLREIADRLRK